MAETPYYDPKTFLLEHDLDKELIQQALELFEFMCGDHELSLEEDKDLKQMFLDVLNKYKDSEVISIEAIKEKIAEQGYEYLTEIFNVTDENLRILASYLPMIQIMKGTKSGLELIFTILNVGYEIKEWWEDPTNLEILSYILFLEVINQPVSTFIVPRLKKFSREYVYPLLTSISLAIAYKLNKTPYIGAITCSKTTLTLYQEFLWLIWAGDSAPENLWTDQKPYQDPITRRSYWQGSKGEELEWDPKTGELDSNNLWSSKSDENDIRVWKLEEEELPEDGELLEWWIEKIVLYGKPEESWSTEDRTIEDPIYTYWSPDSASIEDGTFVRVTIVASPTTALVEINGELTYTIAVKKGTEASWRVYDPSGEYISQSGSLIPTEDTVLNVSLTKFIPMRTLTLSVLPANAKVEISTIPFEASTELKAATTDADMSEAQVVTKTVRQGTQLYWKVSFDGYYEEIGGIVLDQNIQKAITLEKIPYYTFTVNASPSNATVKINAQTTKSLTVLEGSKVTWSVSADNYETQSGEEFITADKTINVTLVALPLLTINTTPSNATVLINGTQRNSIRVKAGTQIAWSVSATNYYSQSGTHTVTADETLTISLASFPTFTVSATPSNATITINGSQRNSIVAAKGTSISWSVSANGYASQSGTASMPSSSYTQYVSLSALYYTITVTSNIAANFSLSSSNGYTNITSNSITVPYGSTVYYTANPTVPHSSSKSGSVYVTQTQTVAVNYTAVTRSGSINLHDSRSGAKYVGSILARVYNAYKTTSVSGTNNPDPWTAGKGLYIVTGPATIKASISASGRTKNQHAGLWLAVGSNESNIQEKTVLYKAYSSSDQAPTSIALSDTYTLAEGQTLYYAKAESQGIYFSTSPYGTVSSSANFSATITYSYTEYT